MTVFDIDAYKAELRLQTTEQLKFLLGQVGRNGESDWTRACEQAIKDEIGRREEEVRALKEKHPESYQLNPTAV